MVGAPNSQAVEVETGMRRVSWVRVLITDEGTECEAVGVGHRLPNVCRVSLDTALALAAQGVPAIVHQPGAPPRKLLSVR